jgi:hypothetical protein
VGLLPTRSVDYPSLAVIQQSVNADSKEKGKEDLRNA